MIEENNSPQSKKSRDSSGINGNTAVDTYNFREELKVAFCINPDVQYCGECVICKQVDVLLDEFIKKLKDKIELKKIGGNAGWTTKKEIIYQMDLLTGGKQ